MRQLISCINQIIYTVKATILNRFNPAIISFPIVFIPYISTVYFVMQSVLYRIQALVSDEGASNRSV